MIPVRSIRTIRVLLWLPCLLLIHGTMPAFAYHYFYLSGAPAAWRTLSLNLIVDNDATVNLLANTQTAITTWNNVTTARNVFGTASQAADNFTGANHGSAWGIHGDGKYEVTFDADGTAMSALGADPLIHNGVALPRIELVGGQASITDGYVVINGTLSFDRQSTLLHELGHFQGLAHSTVGMHTTSTAAAALDPVSAGAVPTMHPRAISGTGRRSLEADDIAALSELYPEASFAALGTIGGTVTRCGDNTAVIGASVRAVNVANSNIQVSRFTSFDGNTTGTYRIGGLPAGTYRIIIEPLGPNGFSLDKFADSGDPPVRADNDFVTEYYSPPDEAACDEPIPDTAAGVAVATSTVVANANLRVGAASLALVVDDTGSMTNEIGAVRAGLSAFISRMELRARTTGAPFPETAIVTFKDDVTVRTVSRDPAELQRIVGTLVATGGGDCPEASNSALITAGNLLRRNGVAMLFTDADARADGPDRGTVTRLYNGKSLTITTLLSGTCSGGLTSSMTDGSGSTSDDGRPDRQLPRPAPQTGESPVSSLRSMPSVPSLSMPRARAAGALSSIAEESPAPPRLGNESSLRTFTELSLETRGVFTTNIGVKDGDVAETERYTNTAANLAVSSVTAAVGLVTPGDAPRGSELVIEVLGSNTSFGNSSLSIDGGGITVLAVNVSTPTRLTALINIQPGAALGFRDVTVTTNLGGGVLETATGAGAFRVIDTPAEPTIIAVTPDRAAQGMTTNVTISGVNTHFAAGVSVAQFGAGVTVNALTVNSPTNAIANVTVDPAASLGYRNVTVRTGSEFATEAVLGPFLVSAPPPAIARVTSIAPGEVGLGAVVDVVIQGVETSFSAASVVQISGADVTVSNVNVTSATRIEARLTVAAAAVPGVRDVIVTTGSEVAAMIDGLRIAGGGVTGDSDGDGLPDAWEIGFGLDPAVRDGVQGADGDPDGDGRTNFQEFVENTHPRGFFARYLAEGAINSFFDLRLAVLSVGSDPGHLQMRFQQEGSPTISSVLTLPPGKRHTVTRADLTALTSHAVSTVVESDQPLVVDRMMWWDATGYGSHAETGVPGPSHAWYLAEGSTSGDFALFYLLQNPNASTVSATVRYLRPFGAPPIEEVWSLPPNSRTTIAVDERSPELASTDVSAAITASSPIIAERAMYFSRDGVPFAAGHESAGATAPSTSWFLAEGATGLFFDEFVLLANPNDTQAEVRLDYLLPDGVTYTQTRTLPPNSRDTVWVDDQQIPEDSGIRPLADVTVSTAVTSVNGVPIVAERTMWWPGPAISPRYWTEAHNTPGATETGVRWAQAEGEVGGDWNADTYILIANPSATAGDARVTLFFEDGSSTTRTVPLLPRSRNTIRIADLFPEALNRRFGATIDSLGDSPAQIVVEWAIYTSPGGLTWTAGVNALTTRLH